MIFACGCLNVTVRCKGDQVCEVKLEELELAGLERADEFFKIKSLVTFELEAITKEQASLVQIRNVGAWAVHFCSNCLTHTHAVHKDLGAGMVLVNNAILTSEENIKNLMESREYSPVFRIVIDQAKVNILDPNEPPSKFSVSQLSNNLRLALTGLDQQLDEAIRSQTAITEENIRTFTDQQYQILDMFKERAHAEHALLSKLVRDDIEKLTMSMSPAKKPPNHNSNVRMPKLLLPNDSVTPSKLVNKAAHPVNGKPHKQPRDENDDNEALFMMEGMDDGTHKLPPPSDHDSDTDDSGSEVLVPRAHRSGHPTLAKSLPVSVPVFHQSFSQRQIIDDLEDEQISANPMDPNNIRASIKALAKSVHGDAVFGDLPRPRFSTQI